MKVDKTAMWRDFMFTVIVRGVGGAILGGLAAALFWRGILRAMSKEHFDAIGLWFGLWSVGGLIVGILTCPKESRPWRRLRRLREMEQEHQQAAREAGQGQHER